MTHSIRSIAVALLCIVAAPGLSSADSAAKRLVFEDCRQAETRLRAMNSSEVPEFVDYLTKVLTLEERTSKNLVLSLGEGSPAPGDPTGALAELQGHGLSRSLEPLRELEAKRCAASLLITLSPYSFKALPDVILLSNDEKLDHETQIFFENTVYSLVAAMRTQPALPDARAGVMRLLELRGTDVGYLAEYALVELGELVLPYLIEKLEQIPDASREDLRKLILRMDPDGTFVTAYLARLYAAIPPERRPEVLRFALMFKDISPLPLEWLLTAATNPGLSYYGRACEALSEVMGRYSDEDLEHLSPDIHTRFVQVILGPEPCLTPVIERRLFRLVLRLSREQVGTLLGAQTLATRHYVTVAALSEDPAAVLQGIVDALYSSDPARRHEALRALYVLRIDEDKRTSIVLRALKQEGLAGQAREQFIVTLAQIILHRPDGKPPEELLPVFLDGLDSGGTETEANESGLSPDTVYTPLIPAISLYGTAAVSRVTRLLRSPEPVVRARALRCLVNIAPTDPSTLREAIAVLGDQNADVREEAYYIVERSSGVAAKDLEKATRSSDGTIRALSSLILLGRGEADGQAFHEIIEASHSAACSERPRFTSALVDAGFAHRDVLGEALAPCVRTELNQTLSTLTKTCPLPEQALSSVRAQVLLVSPPPSPHDLTAFDTACEVPAEVREPFLLSLLDSPLAKWALDVLELERVTLPASLETLRTFASLEGKDRILRTQAAVLVLDRDPADARALAAVHALIHSEQRNALEPVLHRLSKPAKGNVLLPLFDGTDAPLRLWAVRFAGIDALLDDRVVKRLMAFAQDDDRALRYESVLALARVAPRNAALPTLLVRELRGPYSDAMADESFPLALAPVLLDIKNTTTSVTVKTGVRKLLDHLDRGEEGPPAGPGAASPDSDTQTHHYELAS